MPPQHAAERTTRTVSVSVVVMVSVLLLMPRVLAASTGALSDCGGLGADRRRASGADVTHRILIRHICIMKCYKRKLLTL